MGLHHARNEAEGGKAGDMVTTKQIIEIVGHAPGADVNDGRPDWPKWQNPELELLQSLPLEELQERAPMIRKGPLDYPNGVTQWVFEIAVRGDKVAVDKSLAAMALLVFGSRTHDLDAVMQAKIQLRKLYRETTGAKRDPNGIWCRRCGDEDFGPWGLSQPELGPELGGTAELLAAPVLLCEACLEVCPHGAQPCEACAASIAVEPCQCGCRQWLTDGKTRTCARCRSPLDRSRDSYPHTTPAESLSAVVAHEHSRAFVDMGAVRCPSCGSADVRRLGPGELDAISLSAGIICNACGLVSERVGR